MQPSSVPFSICDGIMLFPPSILQCKVVCYIVMRDSLSVNQMGSKKQPVFIEI